MALQWNCRGYRSNYGDLQALLAEHLPTVACLQETCLGNHTPRPPNGYVSHYYSHLNVGRPGTGLATLSHRSVTCTTVPLQTTLQATAFRIGLQHPLTICNIYFSPQDMPTLRDLDSIVAQLPRPFIFLGDFNAKHHIWGNDAVDIRGRTVENFLRTNDVCLLNDGSATHFHTATGAKSALDLAFCSPDAVEDLTWEVHDDLCGSDHYPILIRTLSRELQNRTPRYILQKANWTMFRSLTELPAPPPLPDTPTGEHLEQLCSLISGAADAAIPKSSGRPIRHRVPWWTEAIGAANLVRKRALRRFQHTSALADRISYNRCTAIAKNLKFNAKRHSWQTFVSSINVHTPMSKIWSNIRKISGKYQIQPPPTLHTPAGLTSDPAEVAELLAQHYQRTSSSTNYSDLFLPIKAHAEQTTLDFSTEDALHYNAPITIRELRGALSSTHSSAPGEDEITREMLLHLHPTAFTSILHLFNNVWTSHTYPNAWRRAVVLSFLKPGKTPTETSSYRPIALTSVVGKLMEKIVNTRLSNILESRSYYSPVQYGFRRLLSTQDALVRLASDISTAISRKQHTVCVFFDMEKAYDTTWRYGILYELHRIGIRGHMGYYLQNFLSDRQFCTKVASYISNSYIQEEGVPQGSVLSCCLFAIAINSLPTVIHPTVNSSLYVDDFMIYASNADLSTAERQLQNSINQVATWASTHGFKLSPTKTTAIHIHRRRALTEPTLRIHNRLIPFHPTIKFLGLTFDMRFRWTPYIRSLKADCYRRMSLLRCLSHHDWGGDRTTLLRLYKAYIRSKLEYGAVIYGLASTVVLASLEPVHNEALRICLGAFRSSPIPSLLAETGEPSLALRRDQLMLQFYAHILTRPQLPTAMSMLNVPLANAPPNTFPSRIHSLLEQHGLPRINVMPTPRQCVLCCQLPATIQCSGFRRERKEDMSATSLRALFLDHVRIEHHQDIPIFTDGSKDGASVGYAVCTPQQTSSYSLPSSASIFTAEMQALRETMDIINATPGQNFVVFSDSLSALQALNMYNNNHPIAHEILRWLVRLSERQKTVRFCWVPAHCGVTGNETADAAARTAAQLQNNLPHPLPYKDYYVTIKARVRDKIQQIWQEVPPTNKLRRLKDTSGAWPSSTQMDRRTEVTLCRLRIGHTRLTHGYLMEQGPIPYCPDCIVPITVFHIIAECPTYGEQRANHFPTSRLMTAENTFKHMLADVPHRRYDPQHLMRYLRATHLLKQL